MTMSYEEALRIVADEEHKIAVSMKESLDELCEVLKDARKELLDSQNALPAMRGAPSNVRAILNQYVGQVQSFVDQVGYMQGTVSGLVEEYAPTEEATPAPLAKPASTEEVTHLS